MVDRGGFGPPKSGDDRFTVCSLWPLGNLSVLWSWRLESNPQPADYKSAALPVELHQRKNQKNGALGRNRTTDRGIFSPLLYRLSYQGKNPFRGNKIWRPGWGSNPRPLAWQASVLTSWTTRPNMFLIFNVWWAFKDSNLGPTGYEPAALTNWAKGPNESSVVGVKRLELPTPWSQTTCATNCATPRRFNFNARI